jgi:hypothetical protein
MAVKKSELYSSLWASCDELRGGMDASQYKDYVLVLLFVKYISDRYAGQPFATITIPKGASFADMVKLKGKADIGDQINKKILGPLAQANQLSDMPGYDARRPVCFARMVRKFSHDRCSIFVPLDQARIDSTAIARDIKSHASLGRRCHHSRALSPDASVEAGTQSNCPRPVSHRLHRTGLDFPPLLLSRAKVLFDASRRRKKRSRISGSGSRTILGFAF